MLIEETIATAVTIALILVIALTIFSWILMNNEIFDSGLPPGAKKVFKMHKLDMAGKNTDKGIINNEFNLKLLWREIR
ncbi:MULTISPECIES: hypothetical protein [unclassified Candidatus Frackibacter]|uniref:hypothetical protein n=1 Tax=unclassified Candidatus Frackibacter TaxID=2648818 RepID=UPI00079AFFA0|nr:MULTISPECIES: hypothetical protein [unclassified Candidatus Frackibacter]KXS43670.1 MAG: hypothetical protein AWU54_961 [Candidatus Frackibacter sp. T328-2]SDC01862.1 hypothetical protein SAMN04515661_101302 [Candidatus Frackibacter sp. WG11]SEM33046.1 hypothetical protein SAMN04488698_101302 [Candidatus Frackibacter sp. WG12]SFL38054.1 hypothetical protein SAMN04488699_101301 [Candidatus Frackibacter sp. WG13]